MMGWEQNLMRETLETANEYIEKMIEGIGSFNSYMLNNEPSKALELWPNILEGLEWIVQAVSLTKPIQEKDMNVEELIEILPDLLDAYENGDMILVSDILDYEIKPVLQKWVCQLH